MTVQELIQQLKTGNLPRLVLLTGTEQILLDQALTALKQVIPPDQQTMNLATYDMRQTEVGVALDDATSPPFFGDWREVIITDPYFLTGENPKTTLNQDVDGLTTYFQHPVDSTLMVIVAAYEKLDARKNVVKALKKAALVVDVAPLDARAAQQAVKRALAKQKIDVAPAALEAFAQRTGGDYTAMMHELPKLKLYAGGGASLDVAAIDQLVPKQLTDRVFDLVDAVVRKQPDRALKLYRDLLLQKEEPIALNALMVGQFRLLLQVKILATKGYSQGNIQQTLKVHPFRIKKALQESRPVPLTPLARAYKGLVETETAMKTGRVDKALAFELFVLQYTSHQPITVGQ